MPRLRNRLPSYRKHKQSGQAIVTLSGQDFLLGTYDTDVSRREYDRVIAEWLERGRQPLLHRQEGLFIAEVASRYWAYATQRYVRHGQPTAEQFHIKTAVKHLLRLYENDLVGEFGPLQLKVVRQAMVDAGWARTYVNQQIGVLVRMFKWGVTEGLIPAAVHAALDLVNGLRRGETQARETSKVRGVEHAIVQSTLPFLSPTVRAMIELQEATGMRPGEVCILRPDDLDRSGDVWEFRPVEHKTSYHELDRLICIGPRGQEILRPFLLRPADAYCFSPKESAQWHRDQRHEARKTRLSCGNVPGSNRKSAPKRSPRDKFDAGSYRRAVHRACDVAFPVPKDIAAVAELLIDWRKNHRWSPRQLRHTTASRIRREFDIEAAKAVLGHQATNVTGIYAEVDRRRAIEVARKIG